MNSVYTGTQHRQTNERKSTKMVKPTEPNQRLFESQ